MTQRILDLCGLSHRGGARYFHLGGPLEGPVLQRAVNGLCRTFRKTPTPVAWRYAENSGGALG